MLFTHRDFPSVKQQHVEGAQLFATRQDMVQAIAPRNGIVAELGVGLCEFSEFLINTLHPVKFFAFDLYDLEKYKMRWGKPTTEWLNNLSHLEFCKQRFAHWSDIVYMEVGFSHELLAKHHDRSFDLIYVDAGHTYDDVKNDVAQAVKKVKPSGQLIFNDYTLVNPLLEVEYGVVQVVNELLETGEWKVAGFALERTMFCDIALIQT
jgi:hypothetical protein